MFHPPIYNSPKNTPEQSKHTSHGSSSSPSCPHGTYPSTRKKDKLQNDPDEDHKDASSPYFTSRLSKPMMFTAQRSKSTPEPTSPMKDKRCHQFHKTNSNEYPQSQRYKPYEKRSSDSQIDNVITSIASIDVNNKLNELESSLNSTAVTPLHDNSESKHDNSGDELPSNVVQTTDDEILPVIPPITTSEASYVIIDNVDLVTDDDVNHDVSIDTGSHTDAIPIIPILPIEDSLFERDLEYSMEPRNFSRPFVSSPPSVFASPLSREVIKEEDELSPIIPRHQMHLHSTPSPNHSPTKSNPIHVPKATVLKAQEDNKNFLKTGSYDKLLPSSNVRNFNSSDQKDHDDQVTDILDMRHKCQTSPKKRPQRKSEDITALALNQERKEGRSYFTSSDGDKTPHRPSLPVFSPPPGSMGGTEESMNWQFFSPGDQIAKDSPDKIRKRSSILSFFGDKSHSIFNPKKPSSIVKYLHRANHHDAYSRNERGETVLHCYIKTERVDKLDLLLTYLIHCNSKLLDIDKTDLSGQSPLHLAVKLNDIWSAKVLICFGADINSTNRTLQTPLDIVTERLQITESNEHEELHELLTLLHAVPGGWSAKSRSRLFNESLNSLVNESYEIEDQVQLGVYLDERRLAAFVFKLEELLQRQNLEFSVNNGISLPPGHLDAEGTFFDAMISRQNQILRIKEWKSTLEFKRGAGSRMLFLDGGGIRGLIQIELLSCIEKVTGKRITELFDWIIGTSTGGILALGLVYLGMSLAELRQLYFQLRENVFAGGMLSVARRTEALEQILKEQFKNKKMCDVDYPKVLITAVSTKVNPPALHFFNNCFNDKFSKDLVWKVARYTSAGPTYFSECDNYIDGGVLANNPCMAAWVEIRKHFEDLGLPQPKVALAVSVGTGTYPREVSGETDLFGKGWFDIGGTFKRAHRFIKMLSTALVESEHVAESFALTCTAMDIKFFRFSPSLSVSISPDQTDIKVLLDMIAQTQVYFHTQSCQQDFDKMMRFFKHLVEVSRGLNLNK